MTIKCNNDCANCGKYTSVHINGGKYTEYDCIVANKTVTVYEDGRVKVF